MSEQIRQLEETLEEMMDGLTPIEKALHLVDIMREVYGGEFVIEWQGDTKKVIIRRENHGPFQEKS